jgi:hypothetical protein
MKPHYSGKKSHKFWKDINRLGHAQDELYSLGCVLQNMEEFVLKRLKQVKADAKK